MYHQNCDSNAILASEASENCIAERDATGSRDNTAAHLVDARSNRDMIDLTIAVCTHRRYAGTRRAIESLLCQTAVDDNVRLLIVDNAPESAANAAYSLKDLKNKAPGIDVVIEPQLGVSHARNRALSECNSELLAFLDDDCIASVDWVKNLLRAYETSGAQIAAVGGKVTGIWHTPPPPWLRGDLFCYLSLLDLGDQTIDTPRYLVGGNILYWAPLLKRIGGFKTSLGRVGKVLLSNEEIEVCKAFTALNYRLIYEPTAIVEHVIPQERLSQAWFRQRFFWQAVSDILLESGSRQETGKRQQRSASFLRSQLETLNSDNLPAEQFAEQLGAIYDFVRAIAGPETLPEPASLPYGRSQR